MLFFITAVNYFFFNINYTMIYVYDAIGIHYWFTQEEGDHQSIIYNNNNNKNIYLFYLFTFCYLIIIYYYFFL